MKHRPVIRVLLGLSLILITGRPAWADLAHGFTDLAGAEFDLGTQISYPPPVTDYPGDISYGIVVEPPLGPQLLMWWGGGILAVPNTPVENITAAPTDANAYHSNEPSEPGMAFVVRTGDGFYAKLVVRAWLPNSVVIEYWVQMDGTNDLDDVVAVMPSTWGSVKALYRGR